MSTRRKVQIYSRSSSSREKAMIEKLGNYLIQRGTNLGMEACVRQRPRTE